MSDDPVYEHIDEDELNAELARMRGQGPSWLDELTLLRSLIRKLAEAGHFMAIGEDFAFTGFTDEETAYLQALNEETL